MIHARVSLQVESAQQFDKKRPFPSLKSTITGDPQQGIWSYLTSDGMSVKYN